MMKACFFTVKEVISALDKVKNLENAIYRVLNGSNKTYLSGVVGYSRNGFCNKIKNRSFSLMELCDIFDKISNMSEEQYKNSRIERIKKIISLNNENKIQRKRKILG